MKKVMNIVIGGIENKIFNVFFITMILVVGSFIAVIGVQSSKLRRVAAEANEKQKQADPVLRSACGRNRCGILFLLF